MTIMAINAPIMAANPMMPGIKNGERRGIRAWPVRCGCAAAGAGAVDFAGAVRGAGLFAANF